jgi:hypothetical protein
MLDVMQEFAVVFVGPTILAALVGPLGPPRTR